MAAADVVNETLEPGQEGQHISPAARNVVVYYAADDLAMRASKIGNIANQIASRRLGHTGPENMDKVENNVYALDCDDFNLMSKRIPHRLTLGRNFRPTNKPTAGVLCKTCY